MDPSGEATDVSPDDLAGVGPAPDDGLSPEVIEFAKRFEPFSAIPYWDHRQWTSGWGTRALSPNEQIDEATAEARLRAELGQWQRFVNSVAPNAPEGIKKALTDLSFNTGQSWANSGLGAAVRAGDWATARQKFLQYNKAGGKVLPGLVNRRQAGVNKWFGLPGQTVPLPRPRPPSAPRSSLDQPQNDLADSGAPLGPSNLLGPPQPSLADGDGGFQAPLSRMQMAPQPLSASWVPPTSAPIPPALRPLDPFFPPGLNAGDSQAWPPIGGGDRSGTLDIYNSEVLPFPWLPSGPFGGGPLPDGPFAPPPFSGALSAGRPQTQVTPQRVSASTPSMEDLIPEALKPLVPHLFPYGFNPDWSAASPPAGADSSAVPSQATSRQASAPDPAAIDLLPPELRILVPLFFPQGFGNG